MDTWSILASRAIVSLQNRLKLNHSQFNTHWVAAIVSLQNRLKLNAPARGCSSVIAIVSLQNRLKLNLREKYDQMRVGYSFLTKSAKIKRE